MYCHLNKKFQITEKTNQKDDIKVFIFIDIWKINAQR